MNYARFKKIATTSGEFIFDPDALLSLHLHKDQKGKVSKAILHLKSHSVELDITKLPAEVSLETLGEWATRR